eukprot:gene10670-12412_t
MSSTSDKAKGLANEAVGNIKQGVGKVTGNDKLRAEGVVQEKKGEVQKAVGDTKDAQPDGHPRMAVFVSPAVIKVWKLFQGRQISYLDVENGP